MIDLFMMFFHMSIFAPFYPHFCGSYFSLQRRNGKCDVLYSHQLNKQAAENTNILYLSPDSPKRVILLAE